MTPPMDFSFGLSVYGGIQHYNKIRKEIAVLLCGASMDLFTELSVYAGIRQNT